MTSWRSAFRRIGGPDAVTWPTFWVSLATNLLAHFGTPGQTSASVAVRLLAVLVSEIALMAPLVLLRFTVLRNPARPHPWVALAGFAIAIFTRTAALSWVLLAVGGVSATPYLQRVLGAFPSLFIALTCTALVVSAYRGHTRDLARLLQVRAELERTLASATEQLDERNEEAVRRVTQRLNEELAVLDAGADDTAVEALQRLASDVVRPMSHDLAKSTPMWQPDIDVTPDARVGWREASRALGQRGYFLPAATAGFVTFEMLTPSLVYYPDRLWIVLTVTLLVVFVTFRASNAVLDRALPRTSEGKSLALVVAVAIVAAVIPSTMAGMAVGDAPGLVIGVGGTVVVAAMSLSIALIRALLSEQRRVESELADSTGQLRASLVRLHQVQWFQQKSLSRALHGPVQAAVTAAALRLDGAVRAGAATPELVQGVRASLRREVDVLHVPSLQPKALDPFTDGLIGTWDGVISVSLDADPGSYAALEDDPILRSTVLEVITEAVSNSVRHGQARSATITLHQPSNTLLVLQVADDGTGGAGQPNAGLGSRVLDECALSWSLTASEQGRSLDATFPVPTEMPLGTLSE